MNAKEETPAPECIRRMTTRRVWRMSGHYNGSKLGGKQREDALLRGGPWRPWVPKLKERKQ